MKKLLALAAFAAVTHCGTRKPPSAKKVEATTHLLTVYNAALDKSKQACVKKMQTRAQTRAKAKEICDHIIQGEYSIENCIMHMKENLYSPEKYKEHVKNKIETHQILRHGK